MAQVKRKKGSTQKAAATFDRNLRTFLLVAQFEGKAIGARIAHARDEAGLTQEELAEMASFSKRSLQDYEAGVTVPYRHMREISSLVKRPVEWLLHGEEEESATERLASQVGALADRIAEMESQLEQVVALREQIAELRPLLDELLRSRSAGRARAR